MEKKAKKKLCDFSDYSHIPAEVIRKAVADNEESINCIIKKYKGYLDYIIRKAAERENIQLDENALEDIEQQVWKGLIEDIKKFKI